MIPDLSQPDSHHGPHDWPEDAITDPDNGSYSHRCIHCGHTFTAHKRRPSVCKVCAQESENEVKKRAAFLSANGAPVNWTVHTVEEVRAMGAKHANLLLQLHAERYLRRELAQAFTRLADCIGDIRGTYARYYYPLIDGRKAVAKSEILDVEIAARESAKNGAVPSTTPP